MNGLLSLLLTLQQGLASQPTTALAYLTAWLDPLPLRDLTADPASGDSDELLHHALLVCRECFPAVYADAIQRLHYGATYRDLEGCICAGMSHTLEIPPDTLDAIAYGVPFQPMGLAYDEEFPDRYPDLLPIFGWLEADPTAGLETAYPIIERLIHSLTDLPHGTAVDLVALLQWITGSSGNTAIDFGDDDYWDSGIQPLDWSLEHIALMNEIHSEAQAHIERAKHAVKTLNENATWRQAFIRNYTLLKGVARVDPDQRLRWPTGARRRTEPTADPTT